MVMTRMGCPSPVQLKSKTIGETRVSLKPFWCIVAANLMLMLVLSAMPSEARTLAAVKADDVLRVGLTGDYAPYSLRGPDGKITGADVTMAQTLAKTLGVALEIVPTTWKSMTADFEAGRFDIAMGGVSIR
jgi:cyclohexadienyl dehydratase